MSTTQHTRHHTYIWLIFLVLILGTSLISCGDAGAGSSSSSQGSSTGPVYVSSQADLEAMENDLSKTYILQNDITISTDSWTALGSTGDPSTSTAFSGLLDGNGHVISIEAASGGKVTWDGLFYQLSSANEGDLVVKNLDIKTVSDLEFNSTNTGVLAKNLTGGLIENIELYGSGGSSSTANIDLNATADTSNIGGLIGLISANDKVELKDIRANINMTKTDTKVISNVGGLVGFIVHGKALLDGINIRGALTLPTDTDTSENVGGIVGYSSGNLSQLASTVNVSGRLYIGGLVGRMVTGELSNVYTSGTVNGDTQVGGLVGQAVTVNINFALALGEVSGVTTVGALVASNVGTSQVSNAFYDSDVNTRNDSGLGTAKTTVQLEDVNTFSNFDNLSFWIITAGSYPKLYIEEPTLLRLIRTNHGSLMANIFDLEFSESVNATATSFKLNGTNIAASDVTTTDNMNFSITTSPSESAENTFSFNVISSTDTSETLAGSYKFNFYPNDDKDEYFDVKSCASLQRIGNFLSKKFELVQDIDCDDSKNWNKTNSVAAGFIPIGTSSSNSFTGTLLGNGFKISKLYINRPSTDYVGLFGYNSGGTIEDLGLVDATITGKGYVGILAGSNRGIVKKVSTSGSVTGLGIGVGGIYGVASTNATLSLAYSTSTVSGAGSVGGLVGRNTSTISDSYAAGTVTSTSDVGGLVGSNSGTVERSYYDTEVSGQSDTGKGDGKSTADMKKAATYVGWDTSVWNLVDGAYPTFK